MKFEYINKYGNFYWLQRSVDRESIHQTDMHPVDNVPEASGRVRPQARDVWSVPVTWPQWTLDLTVLWTVSMVQVSSTLCVWSVPVTWSQWSMDLTVLWTVSMVQVSSTLCVWSVPVAWLQWTMNLTVLWTVSMVQVSNTVSVWSVPVAWPQWTMDLTVLWSVSMVQVSNAVSVLAPSMCVTARSHLPIVKMKATANFQFMLRPWMWIVQYKLTEPKCLQSRFRNRSHRSVWMGIKLSKSRI